MASRGWEGKKGPAAAPAAASAASSSSTPQPPTEAMANMRISTDPTEKELADISYACNKLWNLDTNYVEPGVDYELTLGGGKRVSDTRDAAPDPLFKFVKEEVFQRPTYKAFLALLDNYEATTGVTETVTAQEVAENRAFLEACANTNVMKYVHKYLIAKKLAPANRADFIRLLDDLWFKLYRRDAANDSSGFEHVFMGEVRGEEIIGFHNWITFWWHEKAGHLDYRGYILSRKRGAPRPAETERLLTIQFAWGPAVKDVGSTFIGVSPEFELALYTLVFLCGQEDNHVRIGDYNVNVKSYRIGRDRIGTVYPVAED